ncbi:MAG: hypothetical protein ABL898_16590 [Hyphomicrobiaceae bacterium]|nr:hypothetical protein [Hyphomicrobiaceae bacterium]
MLVRDFQEVLLRLEEVYIAGGANKPAKSVRTLIDALAEHLEKTVDQFVADARGKMAPEMSELVSKLQAETFDDRIVSQYATELAKIGCNQVLFEAAITRLKSDSQVKNPEAFAIANRYRNEPTQSDVEFRFSSKREALNFIYETFLTRAQDENKAGIIDRLTRWVTH